MSSAREQYSELVALTQIYLLQEHSNKEWIFSGSDSFKFFKALEDSKRQEKKNSVPETISQKVVPPVPPARPPAPPQPSKVAPEPIAAKEEKREVPKNPVPSPKQVNPEPVSEIPKSPVPGLKQVAPEPVSETPKSPVPGPKQAFVPEPLAQPKEIDLADIRAAVASALPQVRITDTTKAPLAPIVLLALGETGEELLFLHNVASAIDRLLKPAEVVTLARKEREAAWSSLLKRPGLSWIIAFGEEVYSLPGITKGRQKIGEISLLLQPAASAILRDPNQKAALWKLLKQLLN